MRSDPTFGLDCVSVSAMFLISPEINGGDSHLRKAYNCHQLFLFFLILFMLA
jgi:hypothetical protein